MWLARDISDDLFEINKVRRRKRNLLLLFPISGAFYIISAILALILVSRQSFAMQMTVTFEVEAATFFLLGLLIIQLMRAPACC